MKLLWCVILILNVQPAVAAGRGYWSEYLGNVPPRSSCATIKPHKLPAYEPITDAQWCYAYATADLLSWEIGKQVSAADIALLANDAKDRVAANKKHSQMIKGSDAVTAAKAALENGICLEVDLPSSKYLIPGSSAGYDLSVTQMIGRLESLKENFDRSKNPQEICDNLPAIHEIFPHLTNSDLAKIIVKSKQLEVVSRLRDANCNGRRLKLPEPRTPVVVFGSSSNRGQDFEGRQLLNRLDQLLPNQPVLLAVKPEFIGIRDYAPGEGHAVTVIGRRFNQAKQECEYLVRDLVTTCKKDLFSCNDGERWASESHIRSNVFELLYLKK